MKKKNYYAYIVPASTKSGVVNDWEKCQKIVSGKSGARYRAFGTKEEAEKWLKLGADYKIKRVKKLERGIYFDAGTGRGSGVEVNVTDETGRPLLYKILLKKTLSRHETIFLDAKASNNYGELLGMKYALEIAGKEGVKKIFGDSRLVIDFWSKWKIKRKEVLEETVKLAKEVSRTRNDFEKSGGEVKRISGADNPADLGFHKS